MKRAGEDECSCEKTLDEMEISLEICANQAKCFCKPSTPFTSLPLHLQTLQSIYKPALHSQTLHSIYRPTTPVTNPPLQLQTHHNSYRPTTQTNTNIKSFSSTITATSLIFVAKEKSKKRTERCRCSSCCFPRPSKSVDRSTLRHEIVGVIFENFE